MAAVTYNGAMTTGHSKYRPTSLIGSQTKMFVDGQAVIVAGDSIVPHGGHSGQAVPSQTKLFIQGKPAILIGDRISCGDMVAQGSPKLFVG